MILLTPVRHAWTQRDLVGGDIAINFANTVSGWGTDNEDWLADFDGFARWARLAGLIDESDYQSAVATAQRHPRAVSRVFSQMTRLRLGFIRVFHAVRRN